MKNKNYYFSITILVFVFAFFASNVFAEESVVSLAVPFSFTHNLYLGSTGNDVKKLQILLNEDAKTTTVAFGQPGSPNNETGVYGSATYQGVKAFQKIHNLPVVGYVGPATRKALNDVLSNGGLLEVEQPRISSVTAKHGTTENSKIVTVVYDGNGEAPTVWFAYGAAMDAVTLMSKPVEATSTRGSVSVTLSDLSTSDYFVKAFVRNSFGTTTSTVMKLNIATQN